MKETLPQKEVMETRQEADFREALESHDLEGMKSLAERVLPAQVVGEIAKQEKQLTRAEYRAKILAEARRREMAGMPLLKPLLLDGIREQPKVPGKPDISVVPREVPEITKQTEAARLKARPRGPEGTIAKKKVTDFAEQKGLEVSEPMKMNDIKGRRLENATTEK